MSLHRYDSSRDANEGAIVEALEGIGVLVHRMSKPVDLLCGVNFGRGGSHVALIEVKEPGKPLTGDQQEFISSWTGSPVGVVESPEDAVRFVDREFRFWVRVDRLSPSDCWEWSGPRHRQGYGLFNAKGKPVRTHRLAWELANGPIPDGLWVLHRCDNPPCVNPDHLFLGDAKANAQDRQRKGRGADQRGEKHPSVKLTAAQVYEIRSRTYTYGTQAKVAREFGISDAIVHRIRNFKSWTHLTGVRTEPPHSVDCGGGGAA